MVRTQCLLCGLIISLWASCSVAKDFQFPEVTDWKQSTAVQTFVPKTLYEYINGAADLYLAYEFEVLRVAEYVNNTRGQVTVEIYRHKTPTHAFGIYSQERLPNSNFIPVGVEGYYDKNILNFLMGTYYVKISSYNTGPKDQEVLQVFSKKVMENLGEKGGFPSILSYLPAEGKIGHSEKFVARNFLGYSFLHSAFTADYELSGKKFKLFLLDCRDRDECKDIIQKYLQQTKNTEKEVTEGRHTLTDPHHGLVDLYWEGNYVFGVLELDRPDLRSRYLKLFEEKLKKE